MSTSDITPTVVLVHGAFVDASSWNGVIAELKAAGLDVVAPPNLLRGVGVDAAYLTGFVEALGRPVVLVGPLLRRRRHQPDGQRREQRRRARVRRRLRPRGGRDARGDQRPLPRRAAVGRAAHLHLHRRARRAGDRHVRRRRVVPRRGVRRGARGCGRHAGAHAAAGVARRLRDGRHRHAGVEDPAVLGGRGHRRSRHPPATPSATWPSGRAARSPRSTPRTRSRPRIPPTWPRSSSARSRPSR